MLTFRLAYQWIWKNVKSHFINFSYLEFITQSVKYHQEFLDKIVIFISLKRNCMIYVYSFVKILSWKEWKDEKMST